MLRWPALVLLAAVGVAQATDSEYLLNAAGCVACHTAEGGRPLAGGRAFVTPYGTFYSPNITPDRETGIGTWSRAQFVAALKHGTSPDGVAYFPVFPYTSYRLMSDQDAGAIHDHLQSLEPYQQQNREHDLAWWLGRWMMKLWQWWNLDPLVPMPVTKDPMINRGRYLVDALGHCGECHTPRNWSGVMVRQSHYLAGSKQGPDGDAVPNITTDRSNGIGKWDADDLQYFLETGALPNGDYAGGLMTDVIDNSTSKLTAADRKAMAAYLKTVPAVATP
ncbi:MAG: cytochrome c [Chromatiaceae bacterium]|nr:cytochrome c [Chromatiaceae bacterium]